MHSYRESRISVLTLNWLSLGKPNRCRKLFIFRLYVRFLLSLSQNKKWQEQKKEENLSVHVFFENDPNGFFHVYLLNHFAWTWDIYTLLHSRILCWLDKDESFREQHQKTLSNFSLTFSCVYLHWELFTGYFCATFISWLVYGIIMP